MALFIDTMSNAFEDLKDCVLTYVDDIIVYLKTIQEHYTHLEQVLSKINEIKITLNLGKSMFGISKMKFLGYIINQHGIKPDPRKVI